MKEILINSGEDAYKQIADLTGRLFETGVINHLMYPRLSNSGDTAFQALVKNPSAVLNQALFLPVMPVNSARTVSGFSFRRFGQPVGIIVRPCEARAVIELIKMKQIERSDVVIITIDCMGILDPARFRAASAKYQSAAELSAENISAYRSGSALFPERLRKSCSVCVTPSFPGDIHIGLIGVKEGIYVSMEEGIAEKLKAEEAPAGGFSVRADIMAALIKKKEAEKEALISAFKEKIRDIGGFLKEFSTCMRCYNCRVACPICYCRECIFETKVFEHPASSFKKMLEKKEAMKLPPDTLLFHLTRLNHMGFSCVSCGYCSSACPNELPVFELFLALGEDIKKLFGYAPGRSLSDELPLTVFREEELETFES